MSYTQAQCNTISSVTKFLFPTNDFLSSRRRDIDYVSDDYDDNFYDVVMSVAHEELKNKHFDKIYYEDLSDRQRVRLAIAKIRDDGNKSDLLEEINCMPTLVIQYVARNDAASLLKLYERVLADIDLSDEFNDVMTELSSYFVQKKY